MSLINRFPVRSSRDPAAVVRASTTGNVGVSLGYLLVLVDSSVLNVALPDIADSLGGSLAGQQWAVSAYLVTFGALLLGSGAVADRYGALRTYRAGVLLFVLTSVMCALAPTLTFLIVLRALQGAAAALIPGTTLALIGRMNPEPADRHRAIGLYALVTGCGFAAGPAIGGILIAAGGWRWIFLINLPVGLIALAWSRFFPPDPDVRGRGERLDVRGQALAVVFFALVVIVIVEAGERSLIAAWALIPMTCAVVALYWSDRRSAAPAIPMRLLRIPSILRGTVYGFTIQVVMASTLFITSLYLIDTRGLSPLGAGLVLIGYTLGPAVLGPLAGRVVAARGPQLPAVLGQIAAVAGSAAIAAAIFVDASLWVLICAMLLAGMALPMVIVPMTGLVVSGAPAGAAGASGGLFSASRQLGGAFGVAALGAVLASVGGADGAVWAMLAAAVIAGIALVAMTCRPHRAE
ncbi:MFS transporter [Gordonia otitidis]|uniref:MFS transporter n=1 Tax=Gordonia otitidis TaxID=249058 RepID=UPI001D14C26C|nr:MFS transporter [Gordonia otitidis]UEA58136.1 MFS transporter [Gordonia otitidis]